MKQQALVSSIFCLAFAGMATFARADFAGQTILGPLGAGSMVTGNTTGHADDNDGFESGTHIFGIWDGGDDVWRLIWPGGDLTLTLDSLGGSDNDLFLYVPGSLDSSADYSIVGAHDVVTLLGAPAGEYFINVDSTFTSEGSYQLAVSAVPAPASGVMLGAGLLCFGRRRR